MTRATILVLCSLLLSGCATEKSPPPSLPQTQFTSNLWAEDINGRLNAFLVQNGWTKDRGLLSSELTDCGGDWGGLYRKGDKQILLHICGLSSPGQQKVIMLTYTNTTEQEVFGNKKPEQIADAL